MDRLKPLSIAALVAVYSEALNETKWETIGRRTAECLPFLWGLSCVEPASV